MGIGCPHCGRDLSEVGVVKLVGFVQYPNDRGDIPYEASERRLDDTEGYCCASCGEDLSFRDEQEHTRIFGR